ncbi:molybdopterin-dependent oxidoreductase [Streptomyces sp. NBC_01304]|uniref:molybdopterin-dependent oxidoreductase n=1 Tax=Streptomyces sp. NBC_01304 TaxID=2903818 RepID=UPI002E1676AF|nr:molybdopterin-dependent oxidoreductase [Streptomyces sp. NBC_01304]
MSRPSTASLATPTGIATFTVGGEVAQSFTLTVADLRDGWPQHQAEVTFDCATSGPQHHRFEGPLLHDVMRTAEPGFDPRRRKDRSRFVLAISGGDGHHTVLSWGEIDPDFAGSPVLLATRLDDTDLDAAGSQLVVPSDRCGARYISAITSIWAGACRPAHARMPTRSVTTAGPEAVAN